MLAPKLAFIWMVGVRDVRCISSTHGYPQGLHPKPVLKLISATSFPTFLVQIQQLCWQDHYFSLFINVFFFLILYKNPLTSTHPLSPSVLFLFFHLVNKFWETTVLFCYHEKIKTCKKLVFFGPNYTFTSLELFALLHILHQKEKKRKKNIMYTHLFTVN